MICSHLFVLPHYRITALPRAILCSLWPTLPNQYGLGFWGST